MSRITTLQSNLVLSWSQRTARRCVAVRALARSVPVQPVERERASLTGEHGGTDESSGSKTGNAFCQGVTSGTPETDR